MARYLKNLEKHSLLARRKNNTASKMLEEKLKYMEQKFNRDYRQYLRVKSRVQTELRVIEDVASDYDEGQASKTAVPTVQLHSPVEEQHVFHYSRHKGFASTTNQHQKSDLPTDNRKLVTYPSSSKNRSRSLNNSPNIANPISERAAVNGIDSLKSCSIKGEDRSMLPAKVRYNYKQLPSPNAARSHKAFTENYPVSEFNVENNALPVTSDTQATSNLKKTADLSNDVLCKYSPNSQSVHCRHFPCVTPKTYHTISQGGSEVNHVSGEKVDSSVGKLTIHKDVNVHHSSRNETFSNPNVTVIVGLQNHSYKTTILASCIDRNKNALGIEGKSTRSVNELGWRPAFSEPRLERRGSQPTQAETEGFNRPRVTIKDKIRGLKQMVSEMRAKNERNKPRDWVVNYGQHIPPRILLNPVMP